MKNVILLYAMYNTPVVRDKPACDALLDMCFSHTPLLTFNASRNLGSTRAPPSRLKRVLEANDSALAKLLKSRGK